MMKRYAIFTSAGDRSSHRLWLDGDRHFDLFLCYYGDELNRYCNDAEWYHQRKGSKNHNLFYWCQEDGKMAEALFSYEYILVMDDDFQITAMMLNRFFDICEKLEAWVAQPAVTEDSVCPHSITRQVPNSYARATNFVEVCAPCFRKQIFMQVFPYFEQSLSGWGLDYWWWRFLGEPEDRFFIIDATPAFHPVRDLYNPSELDKLIARESQKEEGYAFMNKLNIGPYSGKIFWEVPAPPPVITVVQN